MRALCLLSLGWVLLGCSNLKVTEVDPATGYLPSNKAAAVPLSKPLDLDSKKGLVVVSNSEFMAAQLKKIGYFDEVITVEELETRIVKSDLAAKVPSVRDRIGLNNAAKHFQPFLWLRYDTRRDGNKEYAQFILSDALTLDEYFVTETLLDYVWSGVNDQSNWYPMFNALIDYIRENSKGGIVRAPSAA